MSLAQEMPLFRSILVAVDPDRSAEAMNLLALAVELRRDPGVALTLVNVFPNLMTTLPAQRSPVILEGAEARLAALAHSVAGADQAQLGVKSGFACRGLLDAAARIGADVILLPAPAQRWQDRLLGTTASRVAPRAQCSVFVVRD